MTVKNEKGLTTTLNAIDAMAVYDKIRSLGKNTPELEAELQEIIARTPDGHIGLLSGMAYLANQLAHYMAEYVDGIPSFEYVLDELRGGMVLSFTE